MGKLGSPASDETLVWSTDESLATQYFARHPVMLSRKTWLVVPGCLCQPSLRMTTLSTSCFFLIIIMIVVAVSFLWLNANYKCISMFLRYPLLLLLVILLVLLLLKNPLLLFLIFLIIIFLHLLNLFYAASNISLFFCLTLHNNFLTLYVLFFCACFFMKASSASFVLLSAADRQELSKALSWKRVAPELPCILQEFSWYSQAVTARYACDFVGCDQAAPSL